jgi:hypothetical protein
VRQARAAAVIDDDLELEGLVPPAEGLSFLGQSGPFPLSKRFTSQGR